MMNCLLRIQSKWLEELFHNWWEADTIVDENNLRQKNDLDALESIVDEVIQNTQVRWWSINHEKKIYLVFL